MNRSEFLKRASSSGTGMHYRYGTLLLRYIDGEY